MIHGFKRRVFGKFAAKRCAIYREILAAAHDDSVFMLLQKIPL